MSDAMQSGEFLLYQTEDAQTRIQVRLINETLWLTQKQLAELYQVSVPTINEHLRNIYADRELDAERTIRKLRIVALEGARDVERLSDHYNLEVILHVGYRVRSHRGAQFRRWATEQLNSYLVKGFVLDDERFKSGKDDAYFEELLARIRDIRSTEKIFWKKVLDIYATSVDYDATTELAQQFFATVQNKMHWAAHGHTAAELITLRADASTPNMGLTSWAGATKGGAIRKSDVSIAKNYLNEEELGTLNRIVNAYIEIAELQAQARRAMTMADWMTRLDDFLRMTERELLTHAGKITAHIAQARAEAEFELYRKQQSDAPNSDFQSPVERDFEQAIAKPLKAIETTRKIAKTKNNTESEE